MRKLLRAWLVIGLLLGLAQSVPAQGEPRAIIDKAIKAQGGEDKIAKCKAVQTKAKGRLEIMGGLPFTSEDTAQLSGQMKEITDVEVNGKKITIITVFNGSKGWISASGQTMDMDDKVIEAMKENVYHFRVQLLVDLKDQKYRLASLGEIGVDGRPALGVKVSSKGHKDVNLYFDKENGLLVKIEYRTMDLTSGTEVNEETIASDYQEMDGYKVAKKILTKRDGKKYLEAELIDFKLLDKEFDKSEFAKP